MTFGQELLQLVTLLTLMLILLSVPVSMLNVAVGGKMDWFLLPRMLLKLFGRGTNALAKELRSGAKALWRGRRGAVLPVQILFGFLAIVLGTLALLLSIPGELVKAGK